ncbi:MAG: hypothetical protein HKN03_07035 [Acidimicrobiales bacterium]|nr:hypothetical protein [Acidimicrobiales bacterium]
MLVSQPITVGVVGAGVIGAGWVARMALAGHHVRWFDPNPGAQPFLDRISQNAVHSWQGMDWPMSPESPVRADTLAAAVGDAELIIESVPERLVIKQATYAQIESAAPPSAIIASSTSGFKPSVLADGLINPERLIVAHPFNPVYLIPLVEIVPGIHTSDAVRDRSVELYTEVGMKPLVVRKEIDAFIADRLLEAVWREALWLVNDGIATTEEIDDAIRYGFGLRWAQMGLFETYRIAGGDGGMGAFIAQFGETLAWPWTKLMDTPELTDQLIDTIAAQSDAQSGHLSIAELERHRDDNVVAILNALATTRWGAGEVVRRNRVS